MMDLDPLNNLDQWPLAGLDDFLVECRRHGVREINLTGSNTDPLLYAHPWKLRRYIRDAIPNASLGIRTNGALALSKPESFAAFDRASVSITSLDLSIYRQTMGRGEVPDLESILALDCRPLDIKLNIVLCPETVVGRDVDRTVARAESLGIRRINLREPYGQPHIGDPLAGRYERIGTVLGNPAYASGSASVVYWNVHFTEVESVNLYASGRISLDYPITRGHSDNGTVLGQEHFARSGRVREQWVSLKRPTPQSDTRSSTASPPTSPAN
jgi:hypothetical protein